MPRRAMILAAGRGTRLAPITDERPKPLLPLGPYALLDFPLQLIRQTGIREVMMNLHHLGGQIRDHLGHGEDYGLSIHYSEEYPSLLGTGGGIKRARDFFEGEPFLVLNGDTLVDVDLVKVLEAHKRSGAAATMVLAEAQPGTEFGRVVVDSAMQVRDIAARTGWEGPVHRSGHFCGIHVIEPRIFDYMPDQDVFCINADVYPHLLRAGEIIHGSFLAHSFSDVGTPKRYLRTAEALLDGQMPLPSFRQLPRATSPGSAEFTKGAWISPSAHIDARATLKAPIFVGDGARLEAGASAGPYVLMGERSFLGAGTHVAHTIVWDGAALGPGERIRDAIITPHRRISIQTPLLPRCDFL